MLIVAPYGEQGFDALKETAMLCLYQLQLFFAFLILREKPLPYFSTLFIELAFLRYFLTSHRQEFFRFDDLLLVFCGGL